MFGKVFVSRLRRPIPRSSRKLMLEALEDRLTPTATPMSLPTPAPPPPSFSEAAVTLFWDGFQLIDDQYTGNTAFGAVFFDNSEGIAGVNASIAYYSPYAGPFASLFVQAGEILEYENLLIGHAQAESF